MSMIHPKVLEAQEKRQAADEDKRNRIAAVEAAKRTYPDLKFTHVPMSARHNGRGYLGVTLAYRVEQNAYKSKRDIITVSTALQHPNDEFSREVGRYVAATNFVSGHHIQVRKPRDMTAHDFLQTFFGLMN